MKGPTSRAEDPSILLASARAGDERAFRALVSPHERELRAFCYRMAGALDDADDLMQESLVRAWRGLSAFEGRSSLRTWLYRVTFSACADALQNKGARVLAVEQGPPADPHAPMPPPRADGWLGPCPASLYEEDVSKDDEPSPEARYGARESVALAFLAALQILPPRQRAALLARDVLGFRAEECAEMLECSVEAVNSALVRARKTIENRGSEWSPNLPDEPTTRTLLSRYIEAWERADVAAFVSLLHEEATLAMPPFPLWLQGPRAIGDSIAAMVLTPEARGAFRLVRTEANGLPALAAYQKGEGGTFTAFALHVVSISNGRIDAVTAFLDPGLFARFGLPVSMSAAI